jgi:Zn-dependent M28 family amino/carboxypeptidase
MTKGIRPLAAVVAVAAAAGMAGTAQAANGIDTTALQSAVKVGDKAGTTGIRRHLRALQEIADRPGNNGTRATATQGHEDSVKYVEQQLATAGGYWKVTEQPFVADIFEETAPPTLTPNPAPSPAWQANVDFATMDASGNGTVPQSPIAVIDFTAPTTTASASSAGCEDADFPADLTGKIAVIQRGTCDFGLKVQKAQERHASAVLIFNEGTIGDPDRQGLINGTVEGYGVTIPALEATYTTGRYLVDHPATKLALSASTKTTRLSTLNVIAETTTGRTDRTVISGAHLDSVPEGPGINDDGSGSATQLELALQMSKLGIKPTNQVRFIWFSGEEQGLFGSTYYADQLTKTQRANTAAMLDFDMLASPNYALQIYDGDGSEFGVSGPNGSGIIESVFQKFYDARGLYTERIAFDGRSDYDEFTKVGIPAGGIAAGAEVHKNPVQQSHWGGVVDPDPNSLAGQFDPCYHLLCDRYGIAGSHDNINDTALDINSDAVAHSVLTFAMTTSSTNGTDKANSNATKSSTEWKGSHRRR